MALFLDSYETIPFSFDNGCIFTYSRLKESGKATIGYKGDVDAASGACNNYQIFIYFIDNTIIIGGGNSGYFNTTNAKLIIQT